MHKKQKVRKDLIFNLKTTLWEGLYYYLKIVRLFAHWKLQNPKEKKNLQKISEPSSPQIDFINRNLE